MQAIKTSRERLVRTIILSWIFLAIFLSDGLATTIDSHFRCENMNTQTTFYSYVEEPKLKDSGYSNGLKTGTFNYFKNGSVVLDDKMLYYDGEIDPDHPADAEDHNSSIRHSLDVDFYSDDGNGISEFYAKGYYNNSRAISAWKKLWFDERDALPSDQINVKANAFMSLKGVYNLKYEAEAHNAYFVFTDSAGWSNRTGSRRIDWEQSGLIKGEQIKVVNDLKSSSLFKPRAGFGDWLPCCIVTGTIPPIEPIEGKDSEWPSAGVKATLLPQDKKLTLCSERGTCKDFACILTTGEAATATPGQINWEYLQSLPQVQIESYCEELGIGNFIEYTINVRNLGDVEAQDVVIVNKMPEGASYVEGSATVNDQSQPPRKIDELNLTWSLGNLQAVSGPEGEKSIVMRLNSTDMSGNAEDNKVYAVYRIGSESKETTPVNSILTLPPSLW